MADTTGQKLNLIDILKLLETVSLYDDPDKRKNLTAAAVQDVLTRLKATEKKLTDGLHAIGRGTVSEASFGTTSIQLNTLLLQVKKDIEKVSGYLQNAFGALNSHNPTATKGSGKEAVSVVTPQGSVKATDTSKSTSSSHGASPALPPVSHSPYQPLAYIEQPVAHDHHSVSADFGSGPPDIPNEEIIYDPDEDFIGEGSYGVVYRGTCRGKRVAIKVPKKQLSAKQLEQFRHEVGVMSSIFHPNVVLFMGAATRPTIKIVTELCVTDVEKLIRNPSKDISLYDRMRMAKGAALGMNWLHGICNITHRDLKPANLLVAEDGTVKVTDFGFGKYFESGTTFKGRAKGTPLWMAPEVMLGQETNEKRDVYSFGIILWEFICRVQPFSEYKDWKTFKHAVCYDHKRPAIPADCMPSLKYLIERCWHSDFRQRPGFPEVIFRLNEVLVDSCVDSPEGRLFWKDFFLIHSANHDLEETVSWSNFSRILSLNTEITEERVFENIGLLLFEPNKSKGGSGSSSDENTKEEVTMKRFNLVVNRFGPFFLKEHALAVLDQVNDITTKPWFHGEIDEQEALGLLENRPNGTYLVRLSSSARGKPFTLSIRTSAGAVDHRRISYTYPGKYELKIGHTQYANPTLQGLIGALKAPLKLDGPCPRTREVRSNYTD